ncbi:uncharacterized protein B0T15DRAFT_395083 [Chaetomium strumarium]|uniref:F-box domain-containing protein n=1 Tax=Chaetomium strumarium TaxID=1170767 RepID=A0AAJ0GUE1_9PEZI|nr:hypothetical protein B0T15DRAFT_395083 [Chaetomium strumarium]
MDTRIFSCPICGWMIYDQAGSVSWRNEFRGLCTSSEGLMLTGVGRYTDPTRGAFIAPRNPSARWDDPGYESPDEDQFGAMSQPEINGKRGLIFHAACWSLLEQAFYPNPVPHDRLFEVCDSLPYVMDGSSLNWGHDYGGLAILKDKEFFPWEPRFADRYFPEGIYHTAYSVDPFPVAEVEQILTERPQAPPVMFTSSSSVPKAAAFPGHDPFNSLPVELCSAIAEYLSTSDALNARLSSRAFWHLFDSQQFWASRFKAGSDRSWLFEVRNQKDGRNWRWLYHRTALNRVKEGLLNRRRIWALIQGIKAILELRWRELPADLPPAWHLDPEHEGEWVLAAGSVREEPEGFSQLEEGCRRFKSQKLRIAGHISRIAVSTVRLGSLEYIAGISLTTAAGEVVRLGYSNTAERSVHLAGLAGFRLAVGLHGIHGLQCIDAQTWEPTAWLGNPDGAPRTERAVGKAEVTALEVGFDAFKLVSIAVNKQPDTTTTEPPEQDKLRHSALWYPDVPPPAVGLNEDCFMPLPPYTNGFRPLFWTRFGGPEGRYLRNLTKVTVRLFHGLRRIDFSFDTEEVPTGCRSFGRYGDTEDLEAIEFPIDGPRGEVIDRVQICQVYPPKGSYVAGWIHAEGALKWLKLYTNRGKTGEVRTRVRWRSNEWKVRDISVAPGSAITGLFGAQYRNHGLPITVLGVMTEPIPNMGAGGAKVSLDR